MEDVMAASPQDPSSLQLFLSKVVEGKRTCFVPTH